MIDTFCKECAYAPKSDKCRTCKVSCFDGEPMGLPSNFKRKQQPQTNADRIRAMSDEELVDFFHRQVGCGIDFVPCGVVCFGEKGCPCFTEKDCKAKIAAWLKQPAKEGE